ncbi:hypothetical protein HPB52_012579 [Rhipicephalus sanguineus]|uniref:Uncharacterized protein n=1 Tax=Rhipicephalus sanguineus TaxID=34632 RepID=A0A9D4PP41_RHISA|nr:hypothetical protein HPB52_012579 [Rhipicephalus sanguineus]
MKQSLNYARPPSGQRRLRRTRSDRLLGMISSPVRVRDGSPEPRRLGPNDLTPVHQRTNRRLRGEPPEFPLLREPAKEPPAVSGGNTEMTSPVAATHVIKLFTKKLGKQSVSSSPKHSLKRRYRCSQRSRMSRYSEEHLDVPSSRQLHIHPNLGSCRPHLR